ncbi:Hexuronate transporter [Raoultella terrigena]|uniref:Hexuronate transporter n=1 Tax=Raoultella terrigena TaxID=577 RepID=A0A4V6J1Y3_RAOTE|nr:Hexuronate transporter [Raoultella terrigena]
MTTGIGLNGMDAGLNITIDGKVRAIRVSHPEPSVSLFIAVTGLKMAALAADIKQTMRFYMRKIKGLRWYMIALVTLGTVLGYLTRNTVAAAAPTLMEELHISTQQYSYIIAAYSAAYTVMQPVAGYVLDVLGTKIGYAFFAIAWAIFCGSTALAGSWGGLALARGAVGCR